MSPRQTSTIKRVPPRLEFRVGGVFAGFVLSMLLMQFFLVSSELRHVAGMLPNDGEALLSEVAPILFRIMLMSAVVSVPLVLTLEVIAKSRFTNASRHSASTHQGHQQSDEFGEAQLRESEALSGIARRLNEVTLALGNLRPSPSAQEDPVHSDRSAA